jgi:hypothetical protein
VVGFQHDVARKVFELVGEHFGHATRVARQDAAVAQRGCFWHAIGNQDVVRVQQPCAGLAFRCTDVRHAAAHQRLARCFHLPAVAALRPTACADVRCSARGAVAPQHHRAAVALGGGIGADHAAGLCDGVLCVDQRPLALPAAAHQHLTAARRAAGVQHSRGVQIRLVRRHVDGAAPGAAFTLGRHAAPHIGADLPAQQHLAALHRGGLGLHQAAVAQLAGKNAHRIPLERAQVQGTVSRRLQLQVNAFQPAAGQLDLLSCHQQRVATRSLYHRLRAGVYLGCDQHHIAATRHHPALHRQAGPAQAVLAKAHAPGQRVSVAHAQGRCGKASGVHHRARAHGNARRVDQDQATIGAERAKNRRRVVAQHPVDGGAARGGLGKVRGAAARHVEALPVDRAVVRAGAVLGRDGQVGTTARQRRGAMDGLCSHRLRAQGGGGKTGRQGKRQGQRAMARNCRAGSHTGACRCGLGCDVMQEHGCSLSTVRN